MDRIEAAIRLATMILLLEAVPIGFMYNFDINKAGFVIVGMFILTWVAALLIWRYARIEQRWTARLQGVSPLAQAEAVELMMVGEEEPDEKPGTPPPRPPAGASE
jgi:hypothetical protein